MIDPEIDGIVLHPKQGLKVVEWKVKSLFGWVTVVWVMPEMTREQVQDDIRRHFEEQNDD